MFKCQSFRKDLLTVRYFSPPPRHTNSHSLTGRPQPLFRLDRNTFAVQKSRRCLQHDGHQYTVEKSRGLRTYYRCAESRQLGCRARLVVLQQPDGGGREVTQYKAHTHAVKCM